MKFSRFSILTFCLLLLVGCQEESATEFADLILTNANVYTVNEAMPKAQAIAVKGERILDVGSAEAMQAYANENTQLIDCEGQFLMPGFIEGHGHFNGLGKLMLNLNFLKVQSWDEIVEMVAEKAKTAEPGEWIVGRGWHQEKWIRTPDKQVLGYPYHDLLSAVSPDNPVMLRHASGHSLFANEKAMEMSGISAETPNPFGGEIVRSSNGEAIGVFEEKAMNLVQDSYNEYLATLSIEEKKKIWLEEIELAQQECLAKGVTSFQDAGSSFQDIEWYRELATNQELDLRLWVMLRRSYDEMKDRMEGFPMVDEGDHYFTCRAIKSAVDGALGAFGAWLLKPYNDKAGFIGQNTVPITEVKSIADLAIANDMQFCVHAIGDRANRVVLDIYESALTTKQDPTAQRWRIEHAQHLDTTDIPRFRELGIIASMQGIHCTSDAPFVEKRLGRQRAKYGAYPWRSLLDAGVVIANGTDAPVEDVDPIECFYASVTRKRIDNGFEFFPEQRMTREEAIYSYTLGNAFAAFEEAHKGSIEKGKLADFVVLSQDLSTCTDAEILETEILKTIVGGKVKFEKSQWWGSE
ncbi:MAG: amidohydrolase family protein [Bacteroidota bacterium]